MCQLESFFFLSQQNKLGLEVQFCLLNFESHAKTALETTIRPKQDFILWSDIAAI
jgi:hypothetical protein